MSFDVARVRADFPALLAGASHFDSPGGTQTPTPVIEAMATALRRPLSNRGLQTPAQRNADELVTAARLAMADLLGVDPQGVVFGRSATALTFDFARTLAGAQGWGPGDEVVVTRLDHDANVRPWVLQAARCGAMVRFADFDPATGELGPDDVAAVLSPRTRLVAVTAASNLIGTQPDVAAIARLAHEVGALLWVDGVHHAAHAFVDVPELHADFFVCSPYKFLGPHLGVLTAAPALLETLVPDKLLPSSDAVPERFELGTLPYELLAGTTAAVDHLAGLSAFVPGEASGGGSRRERLQAAHRAVGEHEHALRDRLEQGLHRHGGVTLYSRAVHRTSTLLFTVAGLAPAVVSDHLAAADVNAPAGHFYAIETSRHLGLGDVGGVRAGLTLYNDAEDVNRLLAALATL